MPIHTLNHSPKHESCQSIHLGWHISCLELSWYSSCQRKKRASILAYILHPPARTVPGMTFAYDHTLRDHTLPYTTLPYIAIRYHTLPYTTLPPPPSDPGSHPTPQVEEYTLPGQTPIFKRGVKDHTQTYPALASECP